MSQKYGDRANEEQTAQQVKCPVCSESTWSWTDAYGEAYCTKCGMVVRLIATESAPVGPVYTEEVIELVKEYFTKTGKRCGLGMFLIPYDYQPEIAERKVFTGWVKQNHSEWYQKNMDQPVRDQPVVSS